MSENGDYTRSELGTEESDCVGMYSVHCCVIVDITGLNFITPPLTWTAPFHARLVS